MPKELLIQIWDQASDEEKEAMKLLTPFNLAVHLHNTNGEIAKYSLEQTLPVVVDFVHNNYQ